MLARISTRFRLWVLALLLIVTGAPPAHAQDATPSDATPERGPIVVASKDFSESVIMAKMFILLLREAGYTVEDQTGLGGSPAVRAALESGEVDLYPEYTGTAVSLYHNLPGSALPSDADRLFLLAKSLDVEKQLVWLDRAALNNTYTLMVSQATVDGGIGSVAELANFMNANDASLKICVESEFYAREQDGLKGLERRYGFAFKEENVLFMDVNETYEALRRGDCEVAEGFATDGRIEAWGFRNLEDTLGFFPIYNPAPVIRQEWIDQFPELGSLLNQLGPLLDNASMSQLNARTDIGADGVFASGDEEDAESVAYAFLRSHRLIKPPAITVASKDYTEQLILGKLLVALLQDAGYEVVDKTGLGGSKVVRRAMENGEVDLYVELTGSALAVHNGLPSEALPTDPDRAYLLAKSLDARKEIIWLDRGPFNDTYALMVDEATWNEGLQSITALADFMNANDAPFSICVENDFFGRENDGLPAVEARYGFAFQPENVLLMELDEVYNALRAGQCDVAEGYSTDGRGAAWGFHNLADPLAVFPFYNPAPVVRKAVLDANPELAELLNRFLPLLDDATMSQLNARVDIGADGEPASGDEETPENVARDLLVSAALIPPDSAAGATSAAAVEGEAASSENEAAAADSAATDPENDESGGEEAAVVETSEQIGDVASGEEVTATVPVSPAAGLSPTVGLEAAGLPTEIVVSSSTLPEEELLGQLYVLLLEKAGLPVADRTGLGAPAAVRSALVERTIDLYPELSGRALAAYYDLPPSSWPADAERSYRLAQSLDQPHGYRWLARAGVQAGPTLMIPQALAGQGVRSISDLAAWMHDETEPFMLCVDDSVAADAPAKLASAYDMPLAPHQLVRVGPGETYRSLRDGECDGAFGQPSDGRIVGWQLVALEDDRAFFPGSVAAPVVRDAVHAAFPVMDAVLQPLADILDSASLSRASAQATLGFDGEIASGDELTIRTAAIALLCAVDLWQECTTVAGLSVEGAGRPQALAALATDGPPSALAAATSQITLTGLVALPAGGDAASSAPLWVSTPVSIAVNARAQPSTQADILDLLPANTQLVANGRSTDYAWLRVILPDGRAAWVFASAVVTPPGAVAQLPAVSE